MSKTKLVSVVVPVVRTVLVSVPLVLNTFSVNVSVTVDVPETNRLLTEERAQLMYET